MSSIGIIGAGPAGLAAALTAAESGHEVVVYEAADAVGGMAGSFDVAGLRVDFGSHRLHASTAPEFLNRLDGLLGDDLQARERNGRIRLRDRWVGFPLRLGDMARRLPPDFALRVGAETALGPLRRSGSDPGFLDDVTRRLGPTVSGEFYEPYAVKLYGIDPSELTEELARRRVSASSPLAVLAKAFKARQTDGRTFYYPRRGYGQVSEALADAAVAAGADLRLGTPVTGVRAGAGPSISTAAGTDDVDLVLSTMPVPALVRALDPAPEPTVTEAVESLRVRGMALVYLVVPRPRYTPFDAHYFPSLDITMCRLSEPKNYRDGDDPADHTVLCAELACWPGDDIWSASDDDLGKLVADDLSRAGLPDPEYVEVVVRRLPSVYPVYERATEQARATVDRWLADIPGVLSFGRQGLGVPDNLHHVLDMGQAAAGGIEGGTVDRGQWADELTRFATNVVVD
ncbi:MAG: FAD-dependent oxidoreductase [Actinomycetota bacterium]